MTCPKSDYDIMIPQTQSPMGLELTRSLTSSEFDDSSQGPSLLGQRIGAMFVFIGQSSSQTFSLGYTLYSPSYDMYLTCNERTMGTLDCLLSFYESLVQTQFSRIELIFDLCV